MCENILTSNDKIVIFEVLILLLDVITITLWYDLVSSKIENIKIITTLI